MLEEMFDQGIMTCIPNGACRSKSEYDLYNHIKLIPRQELLEKFSGFLNLPEIDEDEIFKKAVSVLIPRLVVEKQISRKDVLDWLRLDPKTLSKALVPVSFDFVSMIPPGFVGDEDLLVYSINSSFAEIFSEVKTEGSDISLIEQCYSGSLSIDALWDAVIHEENRKDVEGLMTVLKSFKDTFEHFQQSDLLRKEGVKAFVSELKARATSIKGPDIELCIWRPKTLEESFRMGAILHPPNGIRLNISQNTEGLLIEEKLGEKYEYVDIIAAWHFVCKCGRKGLLTGRMAGLQFVLRDIPKRLRATKENMAREQEAVVTQFLSHAFKTPIYNMKGKINRISKLLLNSGGAEGVQQGEALLTEVGSSLDDLANLVELILFINIYNGTPQ